MRLFTVIISILIINITICPKGGYLMDVLNANAHCVVDISCCPSDADEDHNDDGESHSHEHPCAEDCSCIKCVSIAVAFKSAIVQAESMLVAITKGTPTYTNSYAYLKCKKFFQPPSYLV